MPIAKQFVAVGTKSISAYRARSLEPRSYQPALTFNSFLPDQPADLKLKFNTEYRAKIYGLNNGSLSVVDGNIWLLNANPDKPRAEISKDLIIKISVGADVALRFNFSFLVLRTDLAFPPRKFYLQMNIDGLRMK